MLLFLLTLLPFVLIFGGAVLFIYSLFKLYELAVYGPTAKRAPKFCPTDGARLEKRQSIVGYHVQTGKPVVSHSYICPVCRRSI